MAATQTAAQTAARSRSAARNPYSRLPDWLYPSFVVFGLGLFGLYAIWVVFFQTRGLYGPYLSPFYSPLILPAGPIPPAIWIAWIPGAFRLTCYYYRKAYFRAFFLHPRSCAAREPRRGAYRGETGFWIFNNFHRFAFYATVVQVGFLWYDVFLAFVQHQARLGAAVGLGSFVMLVNVICLSGYTFGCHAFRHLAGGGGDCLSCSRSRLQLWKGVTVLNLRHDTWAWASLFTVLLTDLYIRLLILGVIPHGAWN